MLLNCLNKLKNSAGWLFIGLYLWIIFSSFIVQSFYAKTTVYATAIIFAVFMLIALLAVDIKKADFKEKTEIAAFVLTAVISTFNLKIIGSGMGALLVPTDMVLMLMILPKLRLTDLMKRIAAGAMSLLMIWWYAYIHWEYGFNMAGLLYLMIFMTGEVFAEYIKNDYDLEYMGIVQIFLAITTFLLTICYHARSAALCVIIYGIIWKILPFLQEKKIIYRIFSTAVVFGSLVFTCVYTLLGKTGLNIRILYKDVLSGREDIWAELWEAFLKKPLTGIGSSYEMKSFFIFEVHNGIFDILVVHGLIVFALFAFMLLRRLFETADSHVTYRPDCRLAIAGVFTLMIASYFENGFIVPPYSMVFILLMLLARE